MTALSVQEVSITLVLRCEERENMLYIVEIEEGKKIHNCYSSENYFQALIVAKKVFNKLMIKQDEIGNFGVMIEAQQGKGIIYDINNFSFDSSFADSENFYQELCNEFEARKLRAKKDNNTLFRNMVREQKLNEYQEQQFLLWLKRLNSEKDCS